MSNAIASVRRRALSTTDIIEAALEMRGDDPDGIPSMRRLAAALDVTPMALYRHFANQDEILLGMAEALIDEAGLPPADADWQIYLRTLALRSRELLNREPVVMRVFARRPVATPAAQRRLTTTVGVLVNAGFTESEALRAYAAVHTYTLGFCALEQARGAAGAIGAKVDDSPAAAQIAGLVSEEHFVYAVDALIAGVRPATFSD